MKRLIWFVALLGALTAGAQPERKAPQFEGGPKAFEAYARQTIKKPEVPATGRVVYVQFSVSETGEIDDATVKAMTKEETLKRIKSARADDLITVSEYQREAERVLRESPRWKPATEDGKPVPTMMVIPVIF